MAVAENLQELRDTSYGNVPTYSVKASPEAQAVGRNPEVGAKPSSQQEILFSRKSPSDPQVKKSLDKVITEGSRKKSFLESIMPGGRHKEDDYKSEFSRFRQGFVNRYEPIEKMDKLMREKFNTLADSSALFAMFMADRSKNLTAGSIKSGVAYYDKEAGIFRVKDFVYEGEKIDGLMGVIRPLFASENVFGEPLLEVFQAYAIAKRAKDINDSGRQSPVPRGEEDAYLAEMEAIADKYIHPVTNKSYIREAYDKYQAYNNEVIEMMRSTGLITPQEADSWSRSSVYYPFYKDFENAPDAQTKQENAQGQKVNVDSILNIGTETSPTYLPQDKVGSQKLRKLTGSALKIDVPPLEALVSNLDAAINMAMKNVAYQRALRDATLLGFASKIEKGRKMKALKKGEVTNSVYVRENGQDVHYKVHDELLFAALAPISDTNLTTMMTKVFALPARFLRESVTRTPGFMFNAMQRDTLSAFVTSGASFKPFVDTAKAFASDISEFENLGVVTGYDNINDPRDFAAYLSKEMRKKGVDTGAGLLQQGWEKSIGRAWDILGRGTVKSDFATRKNVHDDVLARTNNQAEALFQALEVLNFGRRGGNALYRFFAAATPFFNARVQGLDVLWRTGHGQYSSRSDLGKAQIQKNAFFRGSYLFALTTAYWMLMSDEEEYRKASDYVRDNNWLIKNPFGKEPIRFPIPFEIGLIFKTMPERMLDASFKDSNARDVAESAKRAIGTTLEMNPFGMQIAAPFVEVAFNKNFYTGRQIVPYYIDQNTVAGLQDNIGTSKMAQFLGQKIGYSPLKIDHVAQGYAGTLGIALLDAIDMILRSEEITGDFSASMPTMTLAENPMTRRFFTRAEGTGLQEDFYEMDRYINQIIGTLNRLEKNGRIEEYQKFTYGREHLIDLEGDFNKISKELREMRNDKYEILQADLDPDVKRLRVDEIDAQINEYLDMVPLLKELVQLPITLQLGPIKIGDPTFIDQD